MAVTVSLTSVVKAAAPSTKVTVNWADGTGQEFGSLVDLQRYLNEFVDATLAKSFCLGYLMARSADLSNIASVAGKNFTIDLSNPSPIRVQ